MFVFLVTLYEVQEIFWWLCVWSKRFHSAFMAHKGREASLGIECCLFLVGPLQSCAMLQITPIGFIPELCFQDWSLECTEVGAKCDRQGFCDKFPLFLLSSVKPFWIKLIAHLKDKQGEAGPLSHWQLNGSEVWSPRWIFVTIKLTRNTFSSERKKLKPNWLSF